MMLVVYGPTVTGKTDLAINLAKKLKGELISADSRQVYKGLDIGTGKVSFDSKVKKHQGSWVVDGIKIYGFDLLNPPNQFSAADFIKFASSTMIRIIGLDKLPIVVGGTGFYIKSLIDGIDTLGIPIDLKRRKKIEKLSVSNLYKKLVATNYDRAQKMNESDRKNPRRLIRAIEVSMSKKNQTTTYKLPVSTRSTRDGPTINYKLIGLTASNEYLYPRADKWLETRLENGMVEEVEKLLKKVDSNWLENLGLEYRWITRYILDKISFQEAKRRLKGDIHSLIRHQKTYFNQFKDKEIYDISQKNWQNRLNKDISTWQV